ncbi:MAG: hypothetical protein MK207_03215 [Saprospiraceae bacterium]|nr:hypothetical protein [Saprospiraceae bacterium]
MKVPKLYISNMILFILIISTSLLEAQCPMCRMSAEANLNDGGSMASGLNQGIIYLLIFPYILVSIIAFFWLRNHRRVEQQEQAEEIKKLLEPFDVVIPSKDLNKSIDS